MDRNSQDKIVLRDCSAFSKARLAVCWVSRVCAPTVSNVVWRRTTATESTEFPTRDWIGGVGVGGSMTCHRDGHSLTPSNVH